MIWIVAVAAWVVVDLACVALWVNTSRSFAVATWIAALVLHTIGRP